MVLGFLLLIAAGTLLVWAGNLHSARLSLVDALFTATSAVCVTGLVVVDTGRDLSPFSQVVVLLLIQLGGLGVMTAMTALPLVAGQRIGIRQRLLFAEGMGLDTPQGAVRLLLDVLRLTLTIEGVGALLLFFAFLGEYPPGRAAALAIFHSVSAFCNAGFSLFSTSLEEYAASIAVPGVVMMLLVLGGLGFPVLSELRNVRRERRPLSVAARLVLVTTGACILGGFVLLLAAEWNGAFRHLAPGWKLWNALFAAVTPRTAGFDTVAPGLYAPLGLLVTILLMIIGASPASTGGGVKTTTVGILALACLRDIQGETEVHAFARKIPVRTVFRALTFVLLYLGTILCGVFCLSFTEALPFGSVLFEVVSALGTVGLSMGITSSLSVPGKLVMVLLMFWGRVGIVTFMYSLVQSSGGGRISYVDARIPIG